MIKTPFSDWHADFTDIYSGKSVLLESSNKFDSDELETEFRVIRGTKTMFIGDYQKVQKMEEDRGIYFDLKAKAMVKINNPDFMEFDVYTERILKDRLKSLDNLKTIDVMSAKKYMDYAVKYDNDKRYSDKLIIKPYFSSCSDGIMILTDDFKDYNITMQVHPEYGMIKASIQMSESTSKYTHNYVEI